MTEGLVQPAAAALDAFRASSWAFPAAAAVLGALAAGVAGVVADRLPEQLGWRGTAEPRSIFGGVPSSCDGCGVALGFWRRLPVLGWALARGRCGTCGHRVSPVYPLVEGGCAVASAALALRFGATGEGIAALALLWTFLALAWTDVRERWLPETITIPLFWAGLLTSPFEADPFARIAGAFLGFLLPWATFWLVGRRKGLDLMSGGDLTLVAAIGAWVGLSAVPTAIVVACAAFVPAALLWGRGREGWLPFGPALALGAMTAVLLGRSATPF